MLGNLLLRTVLVVYCCVTNWPKPWQIEKQQMLMFSQFLRGRKLRRAWQVLWDQGVLWGSFKLLAGAEVNLGLTGAEESGYRFTLLLVGRPQVLTGSWPTPVPCSEGPSVRLPRARPRDREREKERGRMCTNQKPPCLQSCSMSLLGIRFHLSKTGTS